MKSKYCFIKRIDLTMYRSVISELRRECKYFRGKWSDSERIINKYRSLCAKKSAEIQVLQEQLEDFKEYLLNSSMM